MPDLISQTIATNALSLPLSEPRKNGEYRAATNSNVNNTKYVHASSDYTRYLKTKSSFRK